MRWFIEVSNIGGGESETQYCVEAKQWQAALQQARKLRGEGGPLSAFSIELLDNGYRAVDKKQNLKYVVKKAPADAPLDDGKNGVVNAGAEGHSAPEGTNGEAPSDPDLAAPPQPATTSTRASGPPPRPRLESTRPTGGKSKRATKGPNPSAAPAAAQDSQPPGARRSSSSPKKGPQKVAELLAAAAMKAGKQASSSVAPKTSTAAAVAQATAPMANASAAPRPAGVQPSAKARALEALPDNVEASPAAARQAQPVDQAQPVEAIVPLAAVESASEVLPNELPEFEVIRSRGEEPSKETPITYREVALAVKPGLTKAQAEALLRARYRSILNEIAQSPKGKFIQLALFDHAFASKPMRPPLATLMWKDWRGDAVLAFPGFTAEASIPPPEEPLEPDMGSLRPTSVIPVDETTGSLPPPPQDPENVVDALDNPTARAKNESANGENTSQAAQVPEGARASASADAERVVPGEDEKPIELVRQTSQDKPTPVDSGREPAGAGVAPDQAAPAGKSERAADAVSTGKHKKAQVAVSDDLIGDLFEKMHDLHFMADVVAGSEFVLSVVKETLPSAFVLVHVFDINSKNFVVVRQHGASQKCLLFPTPDSDEFLERVMRKARSTNKRQISKDGEVAQGRWKAAQVVPDFLLSGPVKQGGRYLGLIELGNPVGGQAFQENEANALDYICEQFAEFLVNRPIVLDADVILK